MIASNTCRVYIPQGGKLPPGRDTQYQRYGFFLTGESCLGNLVTGNDLYKSSLGDGSYDLVQDATTGQVPTGTILHANRTTAGLHNPYIV